MQICYPIYTLMLMVASGICENVKCKNVILKLFKKILRCRNLDYTLPYSIPAELGKCLDERIKYF